MNLALFIKKNSALSFERFIPIFQDFELHAVKITNDTNKMFKVMSEAYRRIKGNSMKVFDLGSSTDLFAHIIASSVTQTITKTVGSDKNTKNSLMKLLESLKESRFLERKKKESSKSLILIDENGKLLDID